MKTTKFTVLLIALFFSIVPQMSYAQKTNIDSKALGEAMLRYQKGQIDLNTFSGVLHAKVAPSQSATEIKKIINSAQTVVKAQSGKSLDNVIGENKSELTLSDVFKTTAKAIENLDVSSFKNMEAYFVATNKIVDASSLDKGGAEYAILSNALMSSKAYMDASLNNELKIANPSSAEAKLMVQGWWTDWGKSAFAVVGGAIEGAIAGAVAGATIGAAFAGVGAIPGIVIGAIAGAVAGGMVAASTINE